VGWLDQPNPPAEAIFRHLAQRNAINFYAGTHVCGVAVAGEPAATLAARVAEWLAALAAGESSPAVTLPAPVAGTAAPAVARRAVLLVGSPRTRKSTSNALGDYLLQQLAARGVSTETIQIYTTFGSSERARAALAAVAAADLVVLAFPLYVDSLPAPVIAALEAIAASRSGAAPHGQLVAIANCGFPEAIHTATALAICAEFAREAGLDWMGGLALGAGEGLVHGEPLDGLGGRAAGMRQALTLAAVELAAGRPIPAAARDQLARGVIPSWLYRLMGGYGWGQMAKQYGAERLLRRQPYLDVNKEQ
jgi:NAD(P)H-dependent FMN reductase